MGKAGLFGRGGGVFELRFDTRFGQSLGLFSREFSSQRWLSSVDAQDHNR
jgi:hypothetical protein